jgi:hypothetical protein
MGRRAVLGGARLIGGRAFPAWRHYDYATYRRYHAAATVDDYAAEGPSLETGKIVYFNLHPGEFLRSAGIDRGFLPLGAYMHHAHSRVDALIVLPCQLARAAE